MSEFLYSVYILSVTFVIFFHLEITAKSAVRATTTTPAIMGPIGNFKVFPKHEDENINNISNKIHT